MKDTKHRLKHVLELTRDHWDRPGGRDTVRANFRRVCACRTPALGGEVYASAGQEKVFYHTCKSKCCPSCGNRGTQLWQREQWVTLPDIPFVGIVLTMPDVFWPVFRVHRHLQHDLPSLGAAVLQQWAWTCYRVRLYIIVIEHTFGGHLNHNPHLHMMVSAGGIDPVDNRWVESIEFHREEIMSLWRSAVTSYIRRAGRMELLQKSVLPKELDHLIRTYEKQWWNVYVTRQMTKRHFLGYAGRYIRRLPISQRRILKVSTAEVVYQSKDTRTKSLQETHCTPRQFVALLSQHVPDHYRHSMRYFGLLAPRSKRATSAALFLLLGQNQHSRPRRLSWRNSLRRDFGVDPLLDSQGQLMHWVRRLEPSAK